MTAGQITYDLRRLRLHGLIERVPGTLRYQVTDTGLHHALLFTHPPPRPAPPHRPRPAHRPQPTPAARLRAADRAYQAAIDELTRQAGLAA